MFKKILLLLVFVALVHSSQWKEKNDTQAPKNIDPVYMIDITKLPKFNAKIILANGEEINFCCSKAMFDSYFRPRVYPEYKIKAESDFKKLLVKDYLSGEWIDAKKALFIFGSKLQGPKGDDLIAVRNLNNAKIFQNKYGGSKILDFRGIKQRGLSLIKYLDMP